MNKFLIRVFILSLILLAIDSIWGILFLKVTEKLKEGRYYKAKYALEYSSEDLLIFGNSVSEADYVTRIFEDTLGITCYNTSRGGQSLPYYNCIKEGTLKRYKPGYVILDVFPDLLEVPPDYSRAGEILKPFYRTHKEIRPVLNKSSGFGNVVNLSNIYCFNSSYFYLLRPMLLKGLDGKETDKGWKPKNGTVVKSSFVSKISSRGELNQTAVKEFDTFVNDLIKNGVRLIFSSSPFYNTVIEETNTIRYVKKIAWEHNIPYLDYANYEIISAQDEYYYGQLHLNKKGAEEFSKILASRIKAEIFNLSAGK